MCVYLSTYIYTYIDLCTDGLMYTCMQLVHALTFTNTPLLAAYTSAAKPGRAREDVATNGHGDMDTAGRPAQLRVGVSGVRIAILLYLG